MSLEKFRMTSLFQLQKLLIWLVQDGGVGKWLVGYSPRWTGAWLSLAKNIGIYFQIKFEVCLTIPAIYPTCILIFFSYLKYNLAEQDSQVFPDMFLQFKKW